MKFSPRCVPLWFGLAALPAFAVAPLASAAEQLQAYAFAQPAQPLAQALNAFSRTTGQSVVYTLELPGVQAPALNGRFSAEQALQRGQRGRMQSEAPAGPRGSARAQSAPPSGPGLR